jgi:hypothetical protein
MGTALMAAETHAVLLFRGFVRLFTEIQYWWTLLPGRDLPDVPALGQRFFHEHLTCGTRSMASLALQSGEGRSLISFFTVFGFEDIEDRVFLFGVMTFDAGVGALFRVLRGQVACWLCGCRGPCRRLLGEHSKAEQNANQEQWRGKE